MSLSSRKNSKHSLLHLYKSDQYAAALLTFISPFMLSLLSAWFIFVYRRIAGKSSRKLRFWGVVTHLPLMFWYEKTFMQYSTGHHGGQGTGEYWTITWQGKKPKGEMGFLTDDTMNLLEQLQWTNSIIWEEGQVTDKSQASI